MREPVGTGLYNVTVQYELLLFPAPVHLLKQFTDLNKIIRQRVDHDLYLQRQLIFSVYNA